MARQVLPGDLQVPHGGDGLSRRQFNLAAITGALASTSLPRPSARVHRGAESQPTDSDVMVAAPSLATDTTVSTALAEVGRGVDDISVEIAHDPQVWDVIIVPSMEPLPSGMLDLQSTPLPGIVARHPGSPVGRVQSIPSPVRVTLAAAQPAVFVRSDVLDDMGYHTPDTLEDLVALVLGVAQGTRFRYGFAASPDATAWAEIASSFASNLAAFNQRDLLATQLTTGYELLASLIEQAAPPDLVSGNRMQAISTFCAGECAVVFDDAWLATEILDGASNAGFAVSTFPVPMGPGGRPGLLLPGLDVAVSSASTDIASATTVAGALLARATADVPVTGVGQHLPAISTEGTRRLTLPVHAGPGKVRTQAVLDAVAVISR